MPAFVRRRLHQVVMQTQLQFKTGFTDLKSPKIKGLSEPGLLGFAMADQLTLFQQREGTL
jgi:hypothetical protein